MATTLQLYSYKKTVTELHKSNTLKAYLVWEDIGATIVLQDNNTICFIIEGVGLVRVIWKSAKFIW